MAITLSIGDYTVRLAPPTDQPVLFWPLWTFDRFRVDDRAPGDLCLNVNVVDRLPDLPHGQLRFDACEGLWRLHESAAGYLLECFRTDDRTLYSRSLLARDYSRAEVWVRGEQDGVGWSPPTILNPIVEICLTSKLALEGGLLIHAAGLRTEGGVWLFTGPSGSGKSTLSDLLAARGECILCDERIIVRRRNGRFRAYGTPWTGTSQIATAADGPLTRVYCVRHGRSAHTARPLSPRESVPRCLQQCFLPHWDRDALEGALLTVGELIERTPCFDLAFLDRPDAVDYLHEHAVSGVRPPQPVPL